MSDITIDPAIEQHGDLHEEHVAEKSYWIVFVILAVLTAIEIFWSYSGLEGLALILPLVFMMVVKFLIVAGVFMHLYFDLKFVNGKFFAMMFGFGLVVAIAVFAGVTATFEFQI